MAEHLFCSGLETSTVGRPPKRKGGPGRGREGHTNFFLTSSDSVDELDSVEKLLFTKMIIKKKCKTITDDECMFLAFELGSCEIANVRSDCQKVKSLYKDLDFLKDNKNYQL